MFWFRNGPLKLRAGDLNAGSQQQQQHSGWRILFCIQKSISGAAAPARIWAGHYTCRLLTAAFLPPFATYRVKNYQRSVGGAGVSYGPVLSNIYVNTLPECHTTNTRGVQQISRKFSQYLEKAHNWAISFVKAPTTTYTLKNLLRHLLLNGHFKLGESTRN